MGDLYFYLYLIQPINQEMHAKSHNFKPLPVVYKTPFQLQSEDGLVNAETCSCYVPLIKHFQIIKLCLTINLQMLLAVYAECLNIIQTSPFQTAQHPQIFASLPASL